MIQDAVMLFDPVTKGDKPFPSHAMQYRYYHGMIPWNYNPWTGSSRYSDDIRVDPCGVNIKVVSSTRGIPTWYKELQDEFI